MPKMRTRNPFTGKANKGSRPDSRPTLDRYKVIRQQRLIKVFDGNRLVIEIPLNSKGEIPKRFAFDRLLSIYEGTRRGRKRNATIDQNRKANRVFKRSDLDAYLWVLYPNESDLEGVDTSVIAPPKVTIRTERDLGTIRGVNSELAVLNAKIRAKLREGKPVDDLLDQRDGLFEYREGLLESSLGERNYLKLRDLRDELGDRELELAGREEAAAAIERPSWGKGLSNETLLAIAEHEQRNPYDPDWGDSIDPVVVREARQGGTLAKSKQTPISVLRKGVAEIKRELRFLEHGESPSNAEPIAAPMPVQQSSGQMQAGMGIGESAPQGTLLGEFRDDGGKSALIDDAPLRERQRIASERAKGQKVLL